MFTIIVITPEQNHPNETDIIQTLVSDYNCIIHIRKPHFNLNEYRSYLKRFGNAVSNFVLHEHHSLAKEFPVKGIHLKGSDRNSSKEIPNNIKVISISMHSIDESSSLAYPFEYIFYSPLFKSISKENYGNDTPADQLIKTITELKKRTDIPIIGLGGINEENIALVQECGFDGAALLGAVWESEEPLTSFDNIYSRLV